MGYKDYLNGVSWELKTPIPVAAYRGELEPEFENRPEVDLQIVDSAVDGVGQDERISMLKALESNANADDRVISVTSGVSTSHGMSASVSSNGFSGTTERTSTKPAARACGVGSGRTGRRGQGRDLTGRRGRRHPGRRCCPSARPARR